MKRITAIAFVLLMGILPIYPAHGGGNVIDAGMLYYDVYCAPGDTTQLVIPLVYNIDFDDIKLTALIDENGDSVQYKEKFTYDKRDVRVGADGWYQYNVIATFSMPQSQLKITKALFRIDGDLFEVSLTNCQLTPLPTNGYTDDIYFLSAPFSLPGYKTSPSTWQLTTFSDVSIRGIHFKSAQTVHSVFIEGEELQTPIQIPKNTPFVLDVYHDDDGNGKYWGYTYTNVVIEYSVPNRDEIKWYVLPATNLSTMREDALINQLNEYVRDTW